MKLPEISSYGKYSSDNYGVNSLKVTFNNFTLYYSYDTIVAYDDIDDGLVCSENVWTVTTGKHLNWIEPDKKKRVKYGVFEVKLREMLERRTK